MKRNKLNEEFKRKLSILEDKRSEILNRLNKCEKILLKLNKFKNELKKKQSNHE
jgi:hypothetical protein